MVLGYLFRTRSSFSLCPHRWKPMPEWVWDDPKTIQEYCKWCGSKRTRLRTSRDPRKKDYWSPFIGLPHQRYGFQLVAVPADSPAAKAGIRPMMIITHLNDVDHSQLDGEKLHNLLFSSDSELSFEKTQIGPYIRVRTSTTIDRLGKHKE